MKGDTRHIYLIGFMGVGKTTVGKRLAHRLGLPFLDTDDVFADLHGGMTTGDYIRAYGEAAFRPEEQATLRHIASGAGRTVVATGGGVPTYGDHLQIMAASGVVLHLAMPLPAITARMSPEELARRPLWARKSPEELQAFFDGRQAIYNQADFILDGTKTLDQIVQDIIDDLAIPSSEPVCDNLDLTVQTRE